MKNRFLPSLPALVLFAGLLFGTPPNALAQDQQDPPTRVAHLSYMDGSVSYEPSGDQNWVQADVNRPLTTGDDLWADQNSRAELHIGSTAFRMGDQTGISFLNLNDQAVQIQLAQGTLEINVRRLGPDDAYEIDTPNLAFSILRPGEYRLETDPNGDSTVISVYSGQGVATGGGQTFNVTPDQRDLFTGTNELSERAQGAPELDSFENWARSRDYREEHSISARYLSADEAGYEDLDDYGSWRSDPEYGDYWVPNNVGAGWEPYHDGHWAWIAPWGWTWVDNDPWGFTPFHYGRWAMINGYWGWVPGSVAVAPIYAPALVGFVGGGGFGVAVQFGGGVGVGWFPLGPRDVYVPPYRVSPRYVQDVNICDTRVINRTTIVNVYNNYTVNHVTNVRYTYASDPRAVTAVNRNAFVEGRPVAQAAMRVNTAEIQHPRVITTAALTPSRASITGPAAAARVRPPAAVANRRVVTKMTPSPKAEPIGRPRPATNPNLTPAVLNRSGYSPQLQTVRATAAARNPARAPAPAAQPNRPGANPQPNRSSTAPNRPATPPRTAAPNRPATPPNQPRPNERTARPFTPPNRSTTNPRTAPPNRPAAPPNQPRPNARPVRPFVPPNRPTTEPRTAPPNRPTAAPNQPRPNARPARPFVPPNRPAANPRMNESPNRAAPARPRPSEQPRPASRPPARPANRPPQRPQPSTNRRAAPPQRRPPARPPKKPNPPKKKPGGPGSQQQQPLG